MQSESTNAVVVCQRISIVGGVLSSCLFVVDAIYSGNVIYLLASVLCFSTSLIALCGEPYFRIRYINPCLAQIGCKSCAGKYHDEDNSDTEAGMRLLLSPRVDPLRSVITIVSSKNQFVSGATVVAIADNNTIKESVSDNVGAATMEVPTTGRSYQLLIAHADYPAAVQSNWDPNNDIRLTLPTAASNNVGSVVCKSTCHIPGLKGKLNIILDSIERKYMYTDNIAINGGAIQPVYFQINENLTLEDCEGVIVSIKVVFIKGTTSLVEYVKR